MGILTWIILGGISGWIVSMIVDTNEDQGLLGNIVLGVIGAVLGGYLGTRLFDTTVTGFNISSIALAVFGGLVFVGLWRILTGKKKL